MEYPPIQHFSLTLDEKKRHITSAHEAKHPSYWLQRANGSITNLRTKLNGVRAMKEYRQQETGQYAESKQEQRFEEVQARLRDVQKKVLNALALMELWKADAEEIGHGV